MVNAKMKQYEETNPTRPCGHDDCPDGYLATQVGMKVTRHIWRGCSDAPGKALWSIRKHTGAVKGDYQRWKHLENIPATTPTVTASGPARVDEPSTLMDLFMEGF